MAIFISCVKKKRPGRWKARELYNSTLFRYALSYAESRSSDIYILSAKYVVLGLDDMVDYYNETLNDKTKEERLQWARKVVDYCSEKNIDLRSSEFLAGRNYLEPLQQILGAKLKNPLEGLGLGKRVQFLKNTTNKDDLW